MASQVLPIQRRPEAADTEEVLNHTSFSPDTRHGKLYRVRGTWLCFVRTGMEFA